MANRVRSLLLVVTAICLMLGGQKTVSGQDTTDTNMPLDFMMGVPNPIGIEVVTHFIRDKKHGLTKKVLRSTVELGLRRNNVPIAQPRLPFLPYLQVEVATLKITEVDAYVYQPVD